MDKKLTIFKVIAGGPLEVSGKFEIKVPGKLNEERSDTIYLCRCGGSSNKPYCDGSHKRNGFSG
jgi:CDGSH-type Zn-finger protein